jgi:hypothetical protein
MDFNFSSFLGGAATAVTDTIEEETKNAKALAAAGVKTMYAGYEQSMKDNRKLRSEIEENINTVRAYKPEATDAQLLAIASSKPVMESFMTAVKDKYFDPKSLDMNVFAKIIGDNQASPGTAAEKVAAAFAIPKIATTVAAAPDSAETGNFLRDLINRKSKNAGDATAAQTAAALGTTIEQLKGAQSWTKPDFTKGVQFDMSLLKPPLRFDEQIEEAKRKGLEAEKKGDAAGARLASAELLIAKSWKEKTNSDQENFANETARIKHEYQNAKDPAQIAAAKAAYDKLVEPVRSDAQKLADKIAVTRNKAIYGTLEEKKAAEPEMKSLLEQERREALAKHVKEPKPAEDKIPAISALASHTSNSVAIAVAARYGNLLKDDLIVETDAQGNGTFKYVGTDAAKRKEIYNFMAATAASALSPWTDLNGKPLNTNVGAVLNKYVGASGSVPTEPAPPPPPARGSSSLPTRGAAPALSKQDQDAKDWASEHPDDPRAKAIMARLGNLGK